MLWKSQLICQGSLLLRSRPQLPTLLALPSPQLLARPLLQPWRLYPHASAIWRLNPPTALSTLGDGALTPPFKVWFYIEYYNDVQTPKDEVCHWPPCVIFIVGTGIGQ